MREGKEDGLPLIVTASHELKEPLALIRQLGLALEAGCVNESEQQKVLRQIILTSERALRLTTDISRTFRLEDSLFELEPLNPQQLLEEVAHELLPLYRAKNRDIHVPSMRRSRLAVANRDLLRRILLNFGDNALHYAESDVPVELRIHTFNKGEKVRLGVRDFGPAVPVDVWRRLQASLGTDRQTIHARPRSSGLGLFIAGQFAKVMHGSIGASRHQDGATFYVDLKASLQLSLL